ncbi:hypothetical protein CROQUDRAFT_665580 [Cronartium quercuum f. sp. fusiforme G11]|uniref:Symplekin n=1 Tax=Cronartium quercuum f. sp. fusiforme G11 TaxID=708437 RepID=A0A9P6T630_9BASI|nr:hypothetical protein CROQUDRAFT_665580 [Cronartium quercuum f. sp. fusiforme G11]
MTSTNSNSNSTTTTTTTPNDCLALFSAAISAPPSSIQQRNELAKLKSQFHSNSAILPILYPSLLSLINQPNSNIHLRKWVAGIIELAVCRPNHNNDQRLQLILQSTETIHRLLTIQDGTSTDILETKKLAIQAASTSYPIIFKQTVIKSIVDSRQWGFVSQIKSIILSIWRNQSSPIGLRIAANKYVQRVIQVGTRGNADPRKRLDDPNISMFNNQQGHHFLKPKELEIEANNLIEETVRMLFQTKSPDIASAIIVSTGTLVRHRPILSPLIISTLSSYTPPSCSLAALKGVEKTLRITLSHLDRSIPTPAIREALVAQVKRLEDINEKEKDRKRQRKEEEMVAKKRLKANITPTNDTNIKDESIPSHASLINHQNQNQVQNQTVDQLPGFDVTTLPVELVVELVIANLLVLTDHALHEALTNYSRTLLQPQPIQNVMRNHHYRTGTGTPTTNANSIPIITRIGSPVRPTMEPITDTIISNEETIEDKFNQELQTEEDDDDEEEEETKLKIEKEEEDEENLPNKNIFLDNWEPERPSVLNETSRMILLKMTLERIVNGSEEINNSSQEGIWSTLLSRLVTRGMEGEGVEEEEEIELRREDIRRCLFGFVISDFPKRIHFARVWLMEEWLTSRRRNLNHQTLSTSAYDRWLSLILDHILNLTSNLNIIPTGPSSENNPLTSTKHLLSQFLLDLPYLPEKELLRLSQLCQDPNKLTIGFNTLRELTSLKPKIRFQTLDILLSLSTHSQRQTRNAAILCLKTWVVGNQQISISERVVSFAIQLVQKLSNNQDDDDDNNDHVINQVEMEDGETGEDDLVRVENAVLISGLGKPNDESMVVQHLELLLALSVKNPDLLDHLFRVYPDMTTIVQEAVQRLITPMIRTLGPKHPKLGLLVQNCPKGAEPLILRILNIFTEKGGKAPMVMIEAIKSLGNNQSPRLIIATIGEMNKNEIITHLPKILTILNGTANDRLEVKNVFESIVAPPPNASNIPRLSSSNLLTPVELLVLLHQTNNEPGSISIKQSIEAIGICFSITEIFKPEVLAAFMQQVVDELTLPTLFLRTVIQAVQTYKSLQPFVSTTLLSRLILKKIWNQASLWEGFMRCSKIIAPHSFGALLQLPREQLRELILKQSSLKAPLRDYVIKKAGNNKARVGALLEILSDPQQPLQTQTQKDEEVKDEVEVGDVKPSESVPMITNDHPVPLDDDQSVSMNVAPPILNESQPISNEVQPISIDAQSISIEAPTNSNEVTMQPIEVEPVPAIDQLVPNETRSLAVEEQPDTVTIEEQNPAPKESQQPPQTGDEMVLNSDQPPIEATDETQQQPTTQDPSLLVSAAVG